MLGIELISDTIGKLNTIYVATSDDNLIPHTYSHVDWLVCRVFKRCMMNTQHWSRVRKFRVTEALCGWWSCEERCGEGYHVNSSLT